MINYEELASWPCYGCKYANCVNHFLPVFHCASRNQYLRKKPVCRKREDGCPSDWHHYEKEHQEGRF